LPRQLAQDSSNTVLVQADAPADFLQRLALPLQAQQFVVAGGTQLQHFPPQIVCLRDFTWRRLSRSRLPSLSGNFQRLLPFESGVMLPAAIDKAIPRYLQKKRAQVRGTWKAIARHRWNRIWPGAGSSSGDAPPCANKARK
jgi:hypothetical protein